MHTISKEEKHYLRELAKDHIQLANLPAMEERKRLWYKHNALESERPLIVVEIDTFLQDISRPLKCQSDIAKSFETFFQYWRLNNELIDDDKVVPDFFPINRGLSFKLFNLDIKKHYASSSQGSSIGYADENVIVDLEDDWKKLQQSSVWSYDKEGTELRKAMAEDIFGDIIPTIYKNNSLEWFFMPTKDITDLMGLENMLYSMCDYPDRFKELMNIIKNERLAFAKWLKKENLLDLNNGNDYIGSGSYGFTGDLPKTADLKAGTPKLKDLWLNINSQESISVSPDMYKEFVYQYYYDLAKEFGMVYYGCCEPVHDVWDVCLKDMPNLRKVSISPWCNEELMGEKLRGSNIIYSRKPSPNFIGVQKEFEENAFREYISNTLNFANGCNLEFIFRDIYTLVGDITKPKRAIKIVRELIESRV